MPSEQLMILLIAQDTWRHNNALRATDGPTDSARHMEA